MFGGKSTFVVKEHVAALKLTDTFDILDPETQQLLGVAKDEPPKWAKWLRLLVSKMLLPTTVNIYEGNNPQPVVTLKKSPALFRATVVVSQAGGIELGSFKSKLFSLGGGFLVYGKDGTQVADVKGDWKGWNFKFLTSAGQELGQVTKKWGGLGKELFTSADTYVVSLNPQVGAQPTMVALLLAAGLAIDIVFKEKK